MVNKKKYIGQSKNIEIRFKTHRQRLRDGKHWNEYLQSSWKKHGEDSFSFYTIEICSVGELNKREAYFIKKYKSDKREYGYNLDSGGRANRIISEETKAKMSAIFKGRIMSQKTRDKLSVCRKGKPGHKHTEEHKKHMSEIMKGRTISANTRKKLSEKRKGILLSREHKEKISEGGIRRYLSVSKEERMRLTERARKLCHTPAAREKMSRATMEMWKIKREIAKKLGISPSIVTKEMIQNCR